MILVLMVVYLVMKENNVLLETVKMVTEIILILLVKFVKDSIVKNVMQMLKTVPNVSMDSDYGNPPEKETMESTIVNLVKLIV